MLLKHFPCNFWVSDLFGKSSLLVNVTSFLFLFLQLLTLHYDRCAKYYGSSGGQGGGSSDEERKLTMILFSNIFDSLSKMVRN